MVQIRSSALARGGGNSIEFVVARARGCILYPASCVACVPMYCFSMKLLLCCYCILGIRHYTQKGTLARYTRASFLRADADTSLTAPLPRSWLTNNAPS